MKIRFSKLVVVAVVFTVFDAIAQATGTEFKVPLDSSMPPGPKGVAVREGKLLLSETRQRLPKNVGNGLNCTNCHLAGGRTSNSAPWVGIWGIFPEYRSRIAAFFTHRPRPLYSDKAKDWPKGDRTKDARN